MTKFAQFQIPRGQNDNLFRTRSESMNYELYGMDLRRGSMSYRLIFVYIQKSFDFCRDCNLGLFSEKKSEFFCFRGRKYERLGLSQRTSNTCQVVVSALLINLSSCSDDPQHSTARVRTARAMLINFIIPCEYHMSS